MPKPRTLQPKDAIQLIEEIEAYLRSQAFMESEGFGSGGPFEQRLVKALKEEDPEPFEEVAVLFRSRRGNRHPSSEGYQPGLEKIAVLARTWLESLREPVVTAETVKAAAETIWAARVVGYKPDKDLVFTQLRENSIAMWVRKEGSLLATEKKQVPIGLVIRRPPGDLSELDYVSALHYEIQKDAKLRARIEKALSSFPRTAWARVWKTPSLSDLTPKRGRRKKH
jgi:hypothetical protein